MSSSIAIRRLRKEFQLLQSSPEYGIVASPLESNVLQWHFVLHGSSDTPYQGGLYHGKLIFPSNFPMKPPSIMMITESGRFAVNKKICMSMSDFHPELWNPMWGVRSILVGMLSFMNTEELTTGGMEATAEQRVQLAKNSLHAIKNDLVVLELFPDIIIQAEANMNHIDSWPPLPLALPVSKASPQEEQIGAVGTSPAVASAAVMIDKDTKISAEEEGIDTGADISSAQKSKTAKNNARKRAKAKEAKQSTSSVSSGTDLAEEGKK
jgi:ubiquitin-conjugating enzyme E2 J2